MKLSSKNKSGEYFWYLIIIVLIVCIGVFVYKIYNKKNIVQNGTVDNKSSQSSLETTDKDNTKLNYVVNSNNTFRTSVPSKEKDPQNYQKVHYDVVRTLVEDGFTESDINYDEGVSYRIVKDNKLVGYKMEWSIPTECKLAIKYDSNYKLEYSRIGCR